MRKGKNSITRQALQWNPQGSRGRGRPRETWRRCMEREMKDVDMTWVALSKKAQDRDVWRRFRNTEHKMRHENMTLALQTAVILFRSDTIWVSTSSAF